VAHIRGRRGIRAFVAHIRGRRGIRAFVAPIRGRRGIRAFVAHIRGRRGIRAFVVLFVVGPLFVACVSSAPPPPPDLAGWHVLYTRPGWAGEAAVDLRAAGDVMLARHVAALAERDGPDIPLAGVRGLLGGDLTVANLESPLTERHKDARDGPYRLLASPALAAVLPTAGLDALGLANNHGLDGGPAGLADSVAALRAAGVTPVGAGPSEATAMAPADLVAGGLRIALLAFNDVRDPADGPGGLAPPEGPAWASPDFIACPVGADCPHGRAWLSPQALAAVAAAREGADLVVVLVHWGVEYAAEPSARQRDWAARLVAAGADLVLGAHPHVLQPAALVESGGRKGFVAYSLGNLLFDAPDDPALSSGAVVRVFLDREGVALVAAAPVATAGGRPHPLNPGSAPWRAALLALGALDVPPPEPTVAPMIPVGQTAATLVQHAGSSPRVEDDRRPTTDDRRAGVGRSSVVCRRSSQPSRDFQTAQLVATPDASAGQPVAWRWDGTTAQPIVAPAGLVLPAPPTRVAADLRGDGVPLWAALDEAGVVTLRDGAALDAPLLWTNERATWRFTRVLAGDPNDDGRTELLLLLWQPDAAGHLRSQPYLLGWRGGRYRVIWGGSATAVPIQDLAWADLGDDGRGELVVLEGGALPGDPGTHISVWRWHGWGFQLEWRSAAGCWRRVGIEDLDGDGAAEIVATP
jgi:poly-gamma-glutamate synthesis protein (capsule biosynthesis protein)